MVALLVHCLVEMRGLKKAVSMACCLVVMLVDELVS